MRAMAPQVQKDPRDREEEEEEEGRRGVGVWREMKSKRKVGLPLVER